MNSWIDITGWTLLHFVWQGAAIALGAAVLMRLLRHRSPHARYAVACSGLALMLLSPAVTAGLLSREAAPLAAPAVTASSFVPDVGLVSRVAPPLTGAVPDDAAAPIRSFNVQILLPLVVAFWIGGVAILFVQMAGRYWRVRRLHAAALLEDRSRWHDAGQRIAVRLGLSRAIDIVDSASVDTPTVIGWMRPVVLLPIAALANLTPGQVEAILAHELAHIRRHDFIVNALQTIAETLLFYHPAVWWLSGRIRTEREHCCDDIAVDVCGDAYEYAAALTEIAALSVSRPPLVMAASGGSLLDRVRRVLRVEPDGHRRSSSATAVIGLALALVVFGGGLRLMSMAQTPDDGAPTTHRWFGPRDVNRFLGFELLPGPAQYPTDDPRGIRAWGASIEHPAGQMALIGFTARSLIRDAYGLTDVPVSGAPEWMDEESFDIAIRSDVAVASNGISDPDAVRAAVRQYFEQQLNLSWHFETRDFPAYALVRANPDGALGPNITPTSNSCWDAEKLRAAAASGSRLGPGASFCGIDNGFTGVTARKVTMPEFAASVRRVMMPFSPDREIVDRTGLTGAFDFTLRFGPLPLAAVGAAHPAFGALLAPFGVRSLRGALPEQLGLTLEEAIAPHQVLVIDRIDRPNVP